MWPCSFENGAHGAGGGAWRWDLSPRPAHAGASPSRGDWGPPGAVETGKSPCTGVFSRGRFTPVSPVARGHGMPVWKEPPHRGPLTGALHPGESRGALPRDASSPSASSPPPLPVPGAARLQASSWSTAAPVHPSTLRPLLLQKQKSGLSHRAVTAAAGPGEWETSNSSFRSTHRPLPPSLSGRSQWPETRLS